MDLLPCPRILAVCCLVLPAMDACAAMLPTPAAAWVNGAEQRSVVSLFGLQSDLKQRQAAVLRRLRAADPQHQTIERAVFNERNELGLILNRSVELDKIPALMRTVLIQMAHAFPGQDLTVLAYAPSDPPRKIGTARLNARTRDMSYTPER